MKKFLAFAIIVIIALNACTAKKPVLPSGAPVSPSPSSVVDDPTADPSGEPAEKREMRGVWVATVLGLDYPAAPTTSADTLKAEADAILEDAAAVGYNTVFFQVRPSGDALYKSKYYPWSEYLTGTQGIAPDGGFDPLSYWIEKAHALGLELHAWVNPLRVSVANDKTALAADNPAVLHPEWVVEHEQKLYLNPGLPEVRQLINDGIAELAENYALDGIHFDDYFYPSQTFADADAYNRSGGGKTLTEWRVDNINAVIKSAHDICSGKNIRFGVSPIGIWANRDTDERGSDTSGGESLVNQNADTLAWVKNGWLDYIAPQIYWHIGHPAADYALLAEWWSNAVSGTDTDLYIGQAVYRVTEAKNSEDPWYGGDELIRQSAVNALYSQISGTIHFRYKFVKTDPILRARIGSVFNPQTGGEIVYPPIPEDVSTERTLKIGRPESGAVTTKEASYFILGTYDPNSALTVNGKEVKYTTDGGYFGYFCELQNGANTYKFEQPGRTAVSVTVTRKADPVTQPKPVASAQIQDAFPVKDEYWSAGDSVNLSCRAPIGSKVTAEIAGKTLTLSPAATDPPYNTGIYLTTFSIAYTIPNAEKNAILELGAPVYSAVYDGREIRAAAKSKIFSLGQDAPLFAEITADAAFMYPGAATTGGPIDENTKHQKGHVTAVTGDWIRVKTDVWLQCENIVLTTENSAFKPGVDSVKYVANEKIDSVTFFVGQPTNTLVSLTDNGLSLRLSSVTNPPTLTLPDGALFGSVLSRSDGGDAVYDFVGLKDRLDGYYITVSEGALTLNLKRRPHAADGAKPLTGISIVLDPGHGGDDYGAIGPLGTKYSEKHINLDVALKLKNALEGLGAAVYLTRDGDKTLSLDARVVFSRQIRPDAFISVHANSVSEINDSGNIRGLESYHRNDFGAELADLLYATAQTTLELNPRGSKQANLYVTRPTWTPSALVETGFVCTPIDFDLLTSQAWQQKCANALAAAVLAYFS